MKSLITVACAATLGSFASPVFSQFENDPARKEQFERNMRRSNPDYLKSTGSSAQDESTDTRPFYVGVSVGQASAEINEAGLSNLMAATGIAHGPISSDEKDSAWKLYLGYRVNRNFALEVGYVSSLQFTASAPITTFLGLPVAPQTLTASVKAKDTFLISALGILPLANKFSLLGKAGVYTTKTELTFCGIAGCASAGTKREEEWLFGFGASYDFTPNLGIRAEWERFKDAGADETGGESDVDFLSLGIIYRF